jgi:hypothetical protein
LFVLLLIWCADPFRRSTAYALSAIQREAPIASDSLRRTDRSAGGRDPAEVLLLLVGAASGVRLEKPRQRSVEFRAAAAGQDGRLFVLIRRWSIFRPADAFTRFLPSGFESNGT